jgi:hypothetical protein
MQENRIVFRSGVGGDEKRTQRLGLYTGYPVPGCYKYGDLGLQVGEDSNLKQ